MIGKHTILVGDVRAMLATLPDDHFHCVVTSPPYWALRDYGVEGQLGSEKTPEEYIATMVAVFREVRRVLRPDGVCWVNLGDSYARSGGEQGGEQGGGNRERLHMEGAQKRMCVIPDGSGLKPKDIVGIPWRFALAAQADGWWLRSDVIWHKPNPMPESVTDRPTKAHEYLFLLTKRDRYYYDAEAVRESAEYGRCGWDSQQFKAGDITRHHGGPGSHMNGCDPTAGRNLRSVWTVPTESFKGARFATYPKRLITPCIKAGTSEKGCCAKCGAPYERTVEKERVKTRPGDETKIAISNGGTMFKDSDKKGRHDLDSDIVGNRDPYRHVTTTVTTGWRPGCKCEAEIVPCRVLDPFLGSGTTAVVACNLWRDCVGIELNPEYARMAEKRIGMETRPGSWCDQETVEAGGLFAVNET